MVINGKWVTESILKGAALFTALLSIIKFCTTTPSQRTVMTSGINLTPHPVDLNLEVFVFGQLLLSLFFFLGSVYFEMHFSIDARAFLFFWVLDNDIKVVCVHLWTSVGIGLPQGMVISLLSATNFLLQYFRICCPLQISSCAGMLLCCAYKYARSSIIPESLSDSVGNSPYFFSLFYLWWYDTVIGFACKIMSFVQ